LRELVEAWFEPVGAELVLRTSFTVVMIDMLRLTRRTGVRWSPDVTRYVRSVITADGLVSRIAPGMDVCRLLERTCEAFLAEEVWRARIAPENLADWVTLGAGFADRMARLSAAVGSGDPTRRRTGFGSPGTSSNRHPLSGVLLGSTALVCVLLAVSAPDDMILGFNLLTAELGVAIVSVSLFVLTIRRRA
jgi:hypothetical protein